MAAFVLVVALVALVLWYSTRKPKGFPPGEKPVAITSNCAICFCLCSKGISIVVSSLKWLV